MASSSQKDKLSSARAELKRSKRWRDTGSGVSGYDSNWRRWIDLYNGYQWSSDLGTDQLVINIVFSTINVLAPSVAISNPRFVVSARNLESAPQAIITEEVLNYQWRSGDCQREFRLAVLDWLILGHGWCKVGWKTEREEPKESEAEDDDSTGGEATGTDDRDPDAPNTGETEMHLYGQDDRPYVERISPFDMYVDPDARHPKEIRWIAQRTWRAVEDVRCDERYSATQRMKVSGSNTSRWERNDKGDGRQSETKPDVGATKYAEIIEYYDLKANTVGTFCADTGDGDEGGGWLIKPEKIPYAFGHPFVMLRNFEVPDHFYPIGDVQQIESLQLELNETRTQMLNYRKKFRRAWLYDKNRFDRDGIQALESDEDNVMIPVMGDENPANAIAPVPTVITPPEFFDQSAMIMNDIDQVSGVSDYARGNPQQNIRRTATEAGMIADSSNARAQDRLARIEDVLSELGRRMVGLMQQFMTGKQVARIITIPVRGWVNYSSEYITGDFDFEVRGGSTEPQNETFRRQSALQLVDASMPFLEMGVADPNALYMKILRDGFGEKDAGRFIQPPPAPPQEQGAPPAGGPPQGGMPPGPPAMPPPGMDPSMMGGPPMPPMDPMMGGMPPMDPAMMAGMPPELTPEMLAMLLMEERGMPPGPSGIPPELLQVPMGPMG